MYIGKTKRQLCIRIGEHLRDIKKKEPDSPLAQHFLQFHQASTDRLKVKGIYALKLSNRRGDFDRILLKKDKFRIYKLNTLIPIDLNKELNLHVFLD